MKKDDLKKKEMEKLKSEHTVIEIDESPLSVLNTEVEYDSSPSNVESETTETEEEEPGPSSAIQATGSKKKTKRKRCPVCNKKLTVVNQYECRCGMFLCSTHRYAEAHDCTFDYKEEGKRILAVENPVVIAPKLAKI